jgi:hypothetical protein
MKRGRRPLPENERKDEIFSVRLSPEERTLIENSAQALGLKAAAWARIVLLHTIDAGGNLAGGLQ